MIVNFQHSFVFVHIPKTGGSSIATALKNSIPDNHCRLHRICSGLGLPGFRKHLATASTKHETYLQFINNFQERTGLPRSVALSLYPIAFVRHPISRFISLHRYLQTSKIEKYPTVPSDINEWSAVVQDGAEPYLRQIRSLRTQSSFVEGINEHYFIGRFENLVEDVERLVGISANLYNCHT